MLISYQINFYLGFYYLVRFFFIYIFSVMTYKQHALIVIEGIYKIKIRKGEALLFFWFFKNCELIKDSFLRRSNFIPLLRDSIIIIGSRSVTYTFGSCFTYKCWVRVLSKSEFQLSWVNIPILFVGSQSMSFEVRIKERERERNMEVPINL